MKTALIMIALLMVLSLWKGKDAADALRERLTDGIVKESPESLASVAGVSLEIYSLARAMQSEERTDAGRIAVGWVVKNKSKGSTILKTVTRASKKDKSGKVIVYDSDGHYGTGNCTPGRYVNTFRAPTKHVIDLATQVYTGKVKDPTGGATQFDAPETQDKLVAKGVKGYIKSAAQIAATREAAGMESVILADVPNTRFWRKAT